MPTTTGGMTLPSRLKDGSEPIHRLDRYVDIWRKNKEGKWKLGMYMDNEDIADPFREKELSRAAHWAREGF